MRRPAVHRKTHFHFHMYCPCPCPFSCPYVIRSCCCCCCCCCYCCFSLFFHPYHVCRRPCWYRILHPHFRWSCCLDGYVVAGLAGPRRRGRSGWRCLWRRWSQGPWVVTVVVLVVLVDVIVEVLFFPLWSFLLWLQEFQLRDCTKDKR